MCGELWPWSPTPLSGQSEKESLLIGSLAVFFTLNIKVEQKSQASVLAEEGSAFSSPVCPWRPRATSPLSRDSLPSLPPSTTGPGARGAQVGAPFAGPVRAHVPITSLLPQPTAQPTNVGQGRNPNTQVPTASSHPILFSRLQNKIQTVGEQQSGQPLAAPGLKDYVQPSGEIVTLQSNTKNIYKNRQTCNSDKNL